MEQFVHRHPQHINLKAGRGLTALHFAALNNHGDITALLANLVSLLEFLCIQETVCDSAVQKLDSIPLHILIASLHSKCCISELLLRTGLIAQHRCVRYCIYTALMLHP